MQCKGQESLRLELASRGRCTESQVLGRQTKGTAYTWIISYFELGPILNLTSLTNLGRRENAQGLREKGRDLSRDPVRGVEVKQNLKKKFFLKRVMFGS